MGYATRECCTMIIGIGFLIGGAMSDLAVPYFIGKVIDLLEKGDYGAINDLCLYMLAIIIVSGICVGMRASIFNILSERIARNLRRDFYESIMNKDIEFFDARRTGDLGKYIIEIISILEISDRGTCIIFIVSRLNSDIQVVQDTLGTNVSIFVRGVLFILIVLCILMAISPALTGMTFAGIIPLVVFSKFY